MRYKNPTRTNLDIVLYFKNQQSFASSHCNDGKDRFGNPKISNFQHLVTLTLAQVICYNIVHHSSTFTCMPNFILISYESDKQVEDVHKYGWQGSDTRVHTQKIHPFFFWVEPPKKNPTIKPTKKPTSTKIRFVLYTTNKELFYLFKCF